MIRPPISMKQAGKGYKMPKGPFIAINRATGYRVGNPKMSQKSVTPYGYNTTAFQRHGNKTQRQVTRYGTGNKGITSNALVPYGYKQRVRKIG